MSTPARNRPAVADAEQLKQFYKDMLLIRRFEEKCEFAYRAGKIGGYLHLYIGQEATGVGWLSALRPGDSVIGAYRVHGFALQMGTDPKVVMAELFGRVTGCARGKGGSMHLYDIPRGFYGGWGIVGGHVPLGVGLAFAAKYHNTGQVVLCFMGDGAVNAGVVPEVMNMASLWDLPIVFIIENNQFAMGTRLEYHAADTELHKRAAPFAMGHERLDGMDVVQVRRDADRIISQVRETSRPYCVEMMNYRFVGHGAADVSQNLYRTEEEVAEWRNRDPLRIHGQRLIREEIATEADMELWDIEIQRIVEEAYTFADTSPEPPIEEVYEHVYTDMMPEVGH